MKAHKVDGPQAAIVRALRRAGCSVLILSGVGDGCPDLAVGRKIPHGGCHTFLLEVKRDRKASLTPAQVTFRETWKGHVATVCSVEDAMIAVGVAT